MSRVAIVVLNWNGWEDTLKCVASLESLDFKEAHVVLVDNGSSDDSVEQFQRRIPHIKLLQSGANLGFGGGCNVGMRHAMQEGVEYIWLVNSDAQVASDALCELVRQAESNQRIGAVGSVIYDADQPQRVQVWGGGRVNVWLGTSHHQEAPGTVDFVSGASVLLRTEALGEVGLFDSERFFMYWEDTDLGFRLRKAGWLLAVAPNSRVWHQESSSLGQGSLQWDAFSARSCVRFLRKHAPWPTLSIAAMLLRMLAKRMLLRRWDRVAAVWQAWRSA
ncbi:MAG: glycosyltransferase family 2 protein [Rhodoferax sp.]